MPARRAAQYVTIIALGLLVSSACGPAPRAADLLLHSGKVLTLDDSATVASAVAVKDGKILEVGDESLRKKYRATEVVDLAGRLVVPGFNDSHIHIDGRPLRHIDLRPVRSIAEIQDSVRAKAALLGAGEWITGYGWAEDTFAEQRLPNREDLDLAAPDNPVILTRAGGHSSVSNSRALALAGITRATPQPSAGMIEHDAAGEPTGIIRERSDLVGRLVPDPTPEELRPSFVQALKDLLPLGITSIIEAGQPAAQPTGFPMWEDVYREHRGELPRAAVQIYWTSTADLEAFGRHPGDGDEWFRVGPLKLLVDGGFTGPSAYTLAPYRGRGNFRGTLNYSPDSLYQIVRAARALGWQMGFHAIGDGAIALTVATFDRVLRESPWPDHRNYLNHFSMLPPDSTLATMARDSILVTQQPNFTYTLEARYQDALEGDRLAHNNPVGVPIRQGIFMALSSDILPIGPMVGLYGAVTRKGKSGRVYGPDEAVDITTALRAYTRNGAYLTREEGIKGTLEAGKLADLVVLSDDLLTIDPARILDTRVDLTVLGGRIVYRRLEASR
jgi:predicted amidohydrolase YtcJ